MLRGICLWCASALDKLVDGNTSVRYAYYPPSHSSALFLFLPRDRRLNSICASFVATSHTSFDSLGGSTVNTSLLVSAQVWVSSFTSSVTSHASPPDFLLDRCLEMQHTYYFAVEHTTHSQPGNMTESTFPIRDPRVQSSPSPEMPPHEFSTMPTVHCVWFCALHCFHEQCYETSLRWFRRLLNHCPALAAEPPINLFIRDAARLRYNIGAVKAVLGEYSIACDDFDESTKLDDHFAIAQYSLGLAHFELKGFRAAVKAFEHSFNSMETEETKYEIYAGKESMKTEIMCKTNAGKENGMVLGERWTLEKTRVDRNIRTSVSEKNWKAERVQRPEGRKHETNGIPVGVLFKPTAAMLKIEVDFGIPLNWEDDSLKEYLTRFNLDVEESQSRTSSTKRERDRSMATVTRSRTTLTKLAQHRTFSTKRERASSVATMTQSRTTSTKLERASSVATLNRSRTLPTTRKRGSSMAIDKSLPPLPATTPGAEPPLPAVEISVIRSQMIEKLDLARRRRMKNSPERATPSPIVPPKPGLQGGLLSKTVTSAPSTSNSIRNSQETIRGPRSSTPTTRRPSSVLPWGSPLTESASLSAHDTPLLPHELPHRPEVASQALVRHCLNRGSIQSQNCNSSAYSSESLAHQAHPETPNTATIDFAYEYQSSTNTRFGSDSQTGLRITGLDRMGRGEYQVSSPRTNSSVYNLYAERAWAVEAEIANELENDEDTEQETEDQNEDYFEICLQPLGYRPQLHNEDPIEEFQETRNNRISMYIDEREDPRPASSVYSTQSKRTFELANPIAEPRPAPSVYSTQTKRASTFPIQTHHLRPASSIYSTQTPPISTYSHPAAPRPASSIYSTQTPPISTSSHQAAPRPASSIYSTQTPPISTYSHLAAPRPASSIYSPQPNPNPNPTPPLPNPAHPHPPRPAPSLYSTQTPPIPPRPHPAAPRPRPASSVRSTDTVCATALQKEPQAGWSGENKEEMILLPATRFEGFENRRGRG